MTLPHAAFGQNARFRVIRPLGQGGFGAVYEAQDLEHDVRVALKHLRQQQPTAIYHFKREFRALATISHPNLVSLHEFFSEGDDFYFTMELIEGHHLVEGLRPGAEDASPAGASDEPTAGAGELGGDRTTTGSGGSAKATPDGSSNETRDGSLDETPGDSGDRAAAGAMPTVDIPPHVLEELRARAQRREVIREAGRDEVREVIALGPPPSPAPVVAAFRQLAEGLCALHAAGILHRDIKPSNVLITDAGRVVLLDFGLAVRRGPRSNHEDEGDDSFAGTPMYMAPELLAFGPPSEASDWFGVGLLLHQTLTGRIPRLSQDAVAVDAMLAATAARIAIDAPALGPLFDLARELLHAQPSRRPDGASVLGRLQSLERATERVSDKPTDEPSDSGDGRPTPTGTDAANRALNRGIAPSVQQAARRSLDRVFVGRDRERAALKSAFDAVAEGGHATVHLLGESGIGKTAIAEHFAAWATATWSAVVFRGRCYSQEALPYKAIDGIVDQICGHLLRLSEPEVAALLPPDIHDLSRLFPVLRRVPAIVAARRRQVDDRDGIEIKQHGFDALRELLRRIAAERHLVVWIDDVQWGDADSAGVLHRLMQGPNPPSLMLLLAYRSDERETAPFLRRMAQLAGEGPGTAPAAAARHIELAPLLREDCAALVEALAPADEGSSAGARAALEESRGNPLLIEELVAFSLLPDGRERIVGARETAALLTEMVRDRVAALPEKWRRLVAAVALAGQPVDADVVRQAAELDSLDGALVQRLRVQHLIRVRQLDGRVEISPYHDRIRESVGAMLGTAERAALHGSLGRVLEARSDAPPRLLAVHFREAGNFERAAHWAFIAAEQASASLAYDDAAALYGSILAWGVGDEPRRRLLRIRRADAMAQSGRCIDAAPLYEEAARGAGRIEAIELHRRAFEEYYTGGMREEAVAILGAAFRSVKLAHLTLPARARLHIALDLLRLRLRGTRFRERAEAELDPEELLRVDLCYSASRTMLRRDSIVQTRCAIRGLLLSLALGEPARIAEGLSHVGAVLSMLDPKAGLAMHEQARSITDRIGTARARGVFIFWLGMADLVRGRWDAALGSADEAIALFRESSGVTAAMQQALLMALITVSQAGRYSELARRADAALAYATATGNRYIDAYVSMPLAVTRLMAGDVKEARRLLQSAIDRTTPEDSTRVGALFWTCCCDVYERDAQAALDRLDRTRRELARVSMPRHPMLRSVRLVMDISLRLQLLADGGAPGSSLASLERDVNRLARIDLPNVAGNVYLFRASIASQRGDRAGALAALGVAAGEFQRCGFEFESACATRRLGELMGDDEGGALIIGADTWMRSRGIADPERWAACRAPGFRASGGPSGTVH